MCRLELDNYELYSGTPALFTVRTADQFSNNLELRVDAMLIKPIQRLTRWLKIYTISQNICVLLEYCDLLGTTCS